MKKNPAREEDSALPFVPLKADLKGLAAAAKKCRGCPLYRDATQTVFGEGSQRAEVILVGEQPGSAEDLKGKPFVGPAGALLDKALAEAGIDRQKVYVTNAVKHFKFKKTGKYRLHRNPGGREMKACRPWLDAEMALIKPKLVVCLGATAARQVIGRPVKVLAERGSIVEDRYRAKALVTVHPSSILRAEDDREEQYRKFVADLKKARAYLEKMKKAA